MINNLFDVSYQKYSQYNFYSLKLYKNKNSTVQLIYYFMLIYSNLIMKVIQAFRKRGTYLTLYCIAFSSSNIWSKFRFKIRRDHLKKIYESRVFESVDDNSQSWNIISKIDGKQNSCTANY